MDSRSDEKLGLKTILSQALDAISAVTGSEIEFLEDPDKEIEREERKDYCNAIIANIEKAKLKINECLDMVNLVISREGKDDNVQKPVDLNKAHASLIDVFNELKKERSLDYIGVISHLQKLIDYLNKDNNNKDYVKRILEFQGVIVLEIQRVIDLNATRVATHPQDSISTDASGGRSDVERSDDRQGEDSDKIRLQLAKILGRMRDACLEYIEYLEKIINKDPKKLHVSRVANDNGEYHISITGLDESQSINQAIDKYSRVNEMLNMIINKKINVQTKLDNLEPLINQAIPILVMDRSNAAQKFFKAIAAAFARFLGLKKQAKKLQRIEGVELLTKLKNLHIDSVLVVPPNPNINKSGQKIDAAGALTTGDPDMPSNNSSSTTPELGNNSTNPSGGRSDAERGDDLQGEDSGNSSLRLDMMKNACEDYMVDLERIINVDPKTLKVRREPNDNGGYHVYRDGPKASQSIEQAIAKYIAVNQMLNIIIGTGKKDWLIPLYLRAKTTLEKYSDDAAKKFLEAIAANFPEEDLRRHIDESGQENDDAAGVLAGKPDMKSNDSSSTNRDSDGSGLLRNTMFAKKPSDKSTQSVDGVDDLKSNDQKEVTPTEREGTPIRLDKK